MSTHLIAIDAGGSKTKAAIKNLDTQETIELNAGGASLSHDFQRACATIKKLIEQLSIKANVSLSDCVLVCGAAGAGCQNNVDKLNEHLGEQLLDKLITTDAKTSLYGAGGGEPMIVVAVGTGSVATKLDRQGHESMIGGWGFIAGDLGSGAEIGRQIITKVLVAFDKCQTSHDPIVQQVLGVIGDNRQAILDWLKSATASDYATLAPIAFAGYQQSQIARQVIQQAALDLQELIESFSDDLDLPVGIIGGLSGQIKLHLSEKIQKRLVAPKGNAIDGAFYLAEQLITQHCLSKN